MLLSQNASVKTEDESKKAKDEHGKRHNVFEIKRFLFHKLHI